MGSHTKIYIHLAAAHVYRKTSGFLVFLRKDKMLRMFESTFFLSFVTAKSVDLQLLKVFASRYHRQGRRKCPQVLVLSKPLSKSKEFFIFFLILKWFDECQRCLLNVLSKCQILNYLLQIWRDQMLPLISYLKRETIHERT